MSRSYRKTPVCGNTTASSDKEFKELVNRTLRHRVKNVLRKILVDTDVRSYHIDTATDVEWTSIESELADDVVLPVLTEVRNQYDSPINGGIRRRCGNSF
jgi:hypothetical protein